MQAALCQACNDCRVEGMAGPWSPEHIRNKLEPQAQDVLSMLAQPGMVRSSPPAAGARPTTEPFNPRAARRGRHTRPFGARLLRSRAAASSRLATDPADGADVVERAETVPGGRRTWKMRSEPVIATGTMGTLAFEAR